MKSAQKIKVLIPYSFPKDIITLLEEHGFEVTSGAVEQENLAHVIKPYQVVVVNSNNKITSDVIDSAPNLQYAFRAGSGYDNIDVKTATEKGITVAITPEANVTAVAEHAFGLILVLARHLVEGDQRIHEKKWRDSSLNGFELEGKTLGILGFGRIGKKLAQIAKGFGMHVIAHDPFVSAGFKKKHGVQDVRLDELLSTSDIISLHIPKTPQTAYLINKKTIAKMKDTALLINTSRGGIIEENDLIDALKNNKLGGAALDVFDSKPEKDVKSELLTVSSGKIILVPHLAASTKESRYKSAKDAALQIISAYNSGYVRWAVNSEVKVPFESEEALEPYLQMIPRFASLAGSILAAQAAKTIDNISLSYSGDLTGYDTTPLQSAAVLPLINTVTDKKVSGLTYKTFIKKGKLLITDSRDDSMSPISGVHRVRLAIKAGGISMEIVGELTSQGPQIVKINQFNDVNILLDDPNLLLVWNKDRPGAVEWVGAQASKNSINIRNMKVIEEMSADQSTGRALMVIHLDRALTSADLDEFTASKSNIVTSVLFESHA